MSPRTPRIHFHRSDNPYPLEMIQQGLETLNSLHLFPALTSWQVCKLHFLHTPNSQGDIRSESAARAATNRYCLRRLKDLGLVKVKPIPRLDNPLAKWEMNYLTKQGHEELVNHRQALGLSTTPHRNPASLTYQTINPHAMSVMDAGISAIVGARHHQLEVVTYMQDMDIRSLIKRHELSWPMEPDALLLLKTATHHQAFFVEVDRGTESTQSPRANSFSSKLERYRSYFQSLRSGDPWLKGYPQPDVMVITTSQARLHNLMEATRKAGGRSAYWFTLQEYVEPPYNFMGQVWQRIGLEGYHSPTERFAS